MRTVLPRPCAAGFRSGTLARGSPFGASNVGAAQLAEARSIASVAAVQNHFHVHHDGDAALLRQCEELGIAYVPFFPLGGGRAPIDAERVERVAARHGATVAQTALAWLLAASPRILAIPGTGVADHLEENVAASGIRLTERDRVELTPSRRRPPPNGRCAPPP
ncbi:aldo/keto reductase [Nocardiopsis lucentensis]|uniref:aldo/keto reductase n=1 Tax=Nocardiopsis lucentensis TaxID=53441 RepID=UPI001F4C55E2|nr:aldo/keto reductase [Nocardiopsis lucentensis]